MWIVVGGTTSLVSLAFATGAVAFLCFLGWLDCCASSLGQFIARLPGMRLIPYLHRKYWSPSRAPLRYRPRSFYSKRFRQSDFTNNFCSFFLLNLFLCRCSIPLSPMRHHLGANDGYGYSRAPVLAHHPLHGRRKLVLGIIGLVFPFIPSHRSFYVAIGCLYDLCGIFHHWNLPYRGLGAFYCRSGISRSTLRRSLILPVSWDRLFKSIFLVTRCVGRKYLICIWRVLTKWWFPFDSDSHWHAIVHF